MNRTSDTATVDYSHCVMQELAKQLGQLRERTVSFVDNGSEQTRQELASFVREVSQTLDIINCHGAKLLTDELEELLWAVADGRAQRGIDASPILVLASEKLSEYLDYLQAGGLDLPLALLPLINDIRACRGDNLLSEALVVAPLFSLPEVTQADIQNADAIMRFDDVISEVRLPLMQSMLAWLREDISDSGLSQLVSIYDQLQLHSPTVALQDLWLAARAISVSIAEGTLESHTAIKMLFGQLERFVGYLVERGGAAYRETPSLPPGVFRNLLYYVALSRSEDERVLSLQRKYRLQEFLPPRSALDSAREALGGPNAKLAGAICSSLAAELGEIKVVITRHDDGDHHAADLQIQAACRQLDQVSHTFLLLGIPGADALCHAAAEHLQHLLSATSEDTTEHLDETAALVLQIESLLDEFRHSGNRMLIFADSFQRDRLEQRKLSAYHYDQIVEKCLGEARGVMASVESAYLACMDDYSATEYSQRSQDRLKNSAELLSGIQSALLILPLPELVPVLKGAAEYLNFYAHYPQSVGETEHHAFADLMVNSYTYLDFNIQKQSGASELLTAAETALTVLGDCISRNKLEDLDKALSPTAEILEDTLLEESEVAGSSGFNRTALLDIESFDSPRALREENLGDPEFAAVQRTPVDQSMLGVFTEEALEQFEQINHYLKNWQERSDPLSLDGLRRCYHTLKGSGRVADASELGLFAEHNEKLLTAVQSMGNEYRNLAGGEVDLLMHESVGVLPQLINQLQSGEGQVTGLAQLQERMASAVAALSDAALPELAESAPTLASLAHEGKADGDSLWAEEYHDRTVSLAALADELAETRALEDDEKAESHSQGKEVSLDNTLDLSPIGIVPPAQASLAVSSFSEMDYEPQTQDSKPIDDDELEQTQVFDAEDKTEVDSAGKFDSQEPTLHFVPDIVTRKGSVVDSTLFRVFESETRSHLRTLGFVLQTATDKVPAELLSRTLHTMHGSARAAGIDDIAELVQPLEDFVSTKSRARTNLLESECEQMDRVFSAIDETLTAMSKGESPPDSATPQALGLLSLGTAALAVESKPNPPTYQQQMESAPTHSQSEEMRNELVDVFVDEASALLVQIQNSVRALRESGPVAEAVRDILRPLHTLKGSARVAGCSAISDVAHALESALLRWPESPRGIDVARMDLLQESIDALTINLEQASMGGALGHFDLLIAELNGDDSPTAEVSGLENPDIDPLNQSLDELENDLDATLELGGVESLEESQIEPQLETNGLEATSIEELSSGGFEKNVQAAPAHTNQHQVQAHVRLDATLVTRLSELSTEVSVGHAVLSNSLFGIRDSLIDLEKTASRLRLKLRELELETEVTPGKVVELQDEEMQLDGTLRLDSVTDELEATTLPTQRSALEDSRQLSEVLSDLDNIRDSLHTQLRRSEEALSSTARLGADLHESLLRSKLIRFDQHQTRFASVVRQTARALGKKVDFEIRGGQQSIDRKMHNALAAPVEHLLRNAVSHGIELPSIRQKAAKDVVGMVSIEVRVDGSDLCVDVQDDGSGVDFSALRRHMNLPDTSDADLLDRLIDSGISTAKNINQIAGRGIGLDSTYKSVSELGGTVALKSSADTGATVSLRIPQRVVLNQAILIEHSEKLYAVPANFVRQVVSANELAHSQDNLSLVSFEDREYRFVCLDSLLSLEADNGPKHPINAIDSSHKVLLVEAGGRRLALQPDVVNGFRELITRPLGTQLEALGLYSGASILADGTTVLILELNRLVERHTELALERRVPGAGQSRSRSPEDPLDRQANAEVLKKILVVDDSITMRTYATRIIEQEGHSCQIARDGLEALQAVNVFIPDLVLLDIEMPRMDGFQLLQRLREDSRFQHLPVIMISSRAGEVNKKKALDLGVSAYLGKPYQATDLIALLNQALAEQNIAEMDDVSV